MQELIEEIQNGINQTDKTMIIGISGHGAAGKSTFAEALGKVFKDNVNILETDPYIVDSALRKKTRITYEYNNEEHQAKMTACHPAAHHLPSLERDIRMIQEGVGFYTIDTHYAPRKWICPDNQITIVEGMSAAFVDTKLFDLSIYFYTDGETEFQRRAVRDIHERGMDIDYLRQTHDERRIQYEVFMHPYHHHFDIVVKNSEEITYLNLQFK